ncbi:MAG: EF-P lysine aminoacylase GenX [Lentisphaerae bacterium]|nr:EF-P lysine aminoacylase GenX [Lentisphaerota bacterium]
MRARMLSSIRQWFEDAGFLAVETPVRLPAPALEDYIEAEPSGEQWLRTSPELHMKRLLAAGYEKIYQIGPCFRKDEKGSRHLPEFTMLEWYRLHGNWRDIQHDTEALLRKVLQDCLGKSTCTFRGKQVDFGSTWDEITVDAAFQKYAGRSLDACLEEGCFEQILVDKIEPQLGQQRPTFLSEYPLACSGLSQPIAGRPDRVERWELYVCGLELANACTELVNPQEQESRFEACAQLRRSEGRPVYPMDQPFMNALWMGLPGAAGIAIGLDRLVMILNNCDSISEVVPFA